MAQTVTFEQLLSVAGKGKGEVKELEAKVKGLQDKRTNLQTELSQVQAELKEAEANLTAPLRDAIKAAKVLGIDIPEEYKLKAGNGNGNGNGGKSNGKFYWDVKGQVPFTADVSRAMWRLSQGSGGSAGKKGEDVLTAAEFWNLVGLEPKAIKLSEKHTVTLPNGKEVTFQKVEE